MNYFKQCKKGKTASIYKEKIRGKRNSRVTNKGKLIL